jgi:type II secretory pathway pseudopilin PulG
MLRSTKPLICPFRSNSAGYDVIPAMAGIQSTEVGRQVVPAKAGTHSANRRNCAVYGLDSRLWASSGQAFRGNDWQNIASGFALLIVMVAAAVLLISLTAALPSIYQEGQREREAELIFRGIQYARAIAGYHQKFQRYPTSTQDLTKLTNGFRFLRKEFADPMTPGGKWRFIHANAQGVLLDSKTQPPPTGGLGQPGAGPGTGGSGTSAPSSMGGSGFGQQGTGGSGFGSSTGGVSSGSNFGGSSSNAQQNSGFSMGTSQGGGTFVVGVASTSHKQSIRTWNQKTHYDEWEFLGIDLGALGIATSIPGLPQGVGAQPNQGNQPNSSGQSNQGNSMAPGQNQSGSSSSGDSTSSGSDFSPQ